MPAVTITTTPPQSVADLLGIDDTTPRNSVVWTGIAQNVDATETVFRARSDTTPARSDPAFRHPAGDRWAMSVYSADRGRTWLWANRDEAVVVLETGIPGA